MPFTGGDACGRRLPRVQAFVIFLLSSYSLKSAAIDHPELPVCENVDISPFDFSVKIKQDLDSHVCPVQTLFRRDTDDDYSCSESKPCKNGACCSKKTGFCNYGPDACGTNGKSPNDVCWSNCGAHAECGRFTADVSKKCPLNVCCSEFGFCGMTKDFCKKEDQEDKGCQSNCDQPDSGASDGDVQSRVIGYYESWAHDEKCREMDFDKIPVEGLTHLYFSFGNITPNDFKIGPMDDKPASLFSDLTDLKKKNSKLQTIIALGGWAFNDNGTTTQPVFSDMVSSAEKRATFISNLLSFLREYAFDGVDFDWEYPGAPDRGGHEEDGSNFTKLLKELQDAIHKSGSKYEVSFTTPTSYWYLKGFDLKAVDHVDFINVMSYDLHGVWDGNNPIGSHVLAHTNMTEIEEAMNLLWRNEVPAKKINLGLGFYGRSFQLADPSCSKPGCLFKAGASPGGCTKNSGTLSYREITDVIEKHKLKPEYDKDHAVKYIVWNQDQWVSYDDEETFKQKIEFANKNGLGGLLIWALDLDTPDYKALQAVLAPKKLNAFADKEKDKAYWEDGTAADCYTTDCGGQCRTGFISIVKQPCGGAKPVTRHSKKKDSSLCCPLSSAPDPKKCRWRGGDPLCNGRCEGGEVTLQQNKWGDGKYCETGQKVYCCEQTAQQENKCHWTKEGDKCKKGEESLTFAGTFLGEAAKTISDLLPPSLVGLALDEALDTLKIGEEKRYCCPPDERKNWKDCAWHGKPGKCDDNHCPIGNSVQLATSAYGQGESCWPRLERQRVFCCYPANNKSPFLPVPLDHLFPHPPTGDKVDTDYKLEVDNTWGDGDADTNDKEPNDSSFGFVVLASPEELQTSLDKRDGSHWELYNCNDAVSEEAQTIQMFCIDISETSNCHKIKQGGFVSGTILEMPPGCGPSKYAVAKSMELSKNQELPHHLAKRDYGHTPIVHDLTFDYEWRRVRRDLGETQMRVDYSNEVGYWDSIVAKAASKKRKRSLEEFGGNHRRWLEEEWRDDLHHGALSTHELHKRWFGKDVIDWLKGLFNPDIKPEFTHEIDATFTAVLVREQWGPCKVKDVDVQANLLAQAQTSVKVATSFGLTIIAKLGNPIDLSQSYLYFKNKGDVSAIFTLDAVGRAKFETGDKELLGLQNFPGATFGVPKLLTVGPNFKLYGAVDAEVTLAGHLESKVDIAKWEVQQTHPDKGEEAGPKALSDPNRDGTGSFDGLKPPTFDYSVTATGQITAHLKPTFEFGIAFDKMWDVNGDAKVAVVADGWTRVMVAAGKSSQGDCPFTYGIDVGADLYATVEAPRAFGWEPRKTPIASVNPVSAKPGGTCPQIEKRSISLEDDFSSAFTHAHPRSLPENDTVGHRLVKRGNIVGPLVTLPKSCFFCPSPGIEGDCTKVSGWPEDSESLLGRRMIENTDSGLGKRAYKNHTLCGTIDILSPHFDSSGIIITKMPTIKTYGYRNPTRCDDYGFGVITTPSAADTPSFATEHILEFQLIKIFFTQMDEDDGNIYNDPGEDETGKVRLCDVLTRYWANAKIKFRSDAAIDMIPINIVGQAFPGHEGTHNPYEGEFVLLDGEVNKAKEGMWGESLINRDDTIMGYIHQEPLKAVKRLKDVLTAYRYHQDATISDNLKKQSQRVSEALDKMDRIELPKLNYKGQKVKPYKTLGFKKRWDEWIKSRAERANKRTMMYLDQYIEQMQGYANSQEDRFEPNLQSLANSVRALKAELAKVHQDEWKIPF